MGTGRDTSTGTGTGTGKSAGKGAGRGRYHHGDLRGALLDAAETLVRERGVDGWSLREASTRVGVSPSAAYHHFASRDALVRALSQRVLARFGERMSRAADLPAGTDPHRRLVAVGQSYVRAALENRAVTQLAFRAGAGDAGTGTSPQEQEQTQAQAQTQAQTQTQAHGREPGHLPQPGPRPPHPHTVLDTELNLLVETGHLPPAARPGADFVLWTAVHGLATLLADGLITVDDPQAADRQTERVVRAVLTGLRQEPEATEPWPKVRSAHTERAAGRPRT